MLSPRFAWYAGPMREGKPSIPSFSTEAAAEDDGVESLALAHASLFAAIATLVRVHGEEATAKVVAALPDRIRGGEYNLERQTH